MRRHIRRHEPDIVDWQPPIAYCRLARRRVILEHESPMRKGPGVRTPATLTLGCWSVVAARSTDSRQVRSIPIRKCVFLGLLDANSRRIGFLVGRSRSYWNNWLP